MGKIREYIKQNKAILFALYVPVHFIWFTLLESWKDRDFTILHCGVDDAIPFIKWFIIPYYLWFPYMVLFVLWFYFKGEKGETIRLYLVLTMGMALSLFIYSVWPNAIHLRPSSVTGNDFISEIVKGLYKIDTDTNVCPSLHVYNTLCIMVAVIKSGGLKNKWLIKAFTVVLSVLIILSTLFLKQHSFIDLLAALALYAVLYVITYFIMRNRSDD